MNTQFLKSKIAVNKTDKKVTVIASDETLDRHGDVLPISQWDLTKFMMSPRMLVDHNHQVESIVGKWDNVRVEGNQLLMDADFHGITELSKAVKEMVDGGYLDTVSVGFIYNGPDKDGATPSFELIETSWVTVPANPNARVLERMKSVKGKPTKDQVAKIKEVVGIKEDEPEAVEDEEPIEPDEDIEADLGDFAEADFEKMGIKLCDSVEDYRAWQEAAENTKTFAVVTARFINEIIATNEKLQQLVAAQDEKVVASKSAQLTKLALKEAARVINDSLHKLNRI